MGNVRFHFVCVIYVIHMDKPTGIVWYCHGTMCDLRYVNTAVDNAIVCHFILNPFWVFWHSACGNEKTSYDKSRLHDNKPIKLDRSLKTRNYLFLTTSENYVFWTNIWKAEHLFDIYAILYILTHHLEAYIRFFFYVLITCSVSWCAMRGSFCYSFEGSNMRE